jgi:hypothetical protein
MGFGDVHVEPRLVDPLVAEPRLQRPLVHAEHRGVGSVRVPQRIPVAHKQPRTPAEPLDRVAGLPVALRVAVEATLCSQSHGVRRLLCRAKKGDVEVRRRFRVQMEDMLQKS